MILTIFYAGVFVSVPGTPGHAFVRADTEPETIFDKIIRKEQQQSEGGARSRMLNRDQHGMCLLHWLHAIALQYIQACRGRTLCGCELKRVYATIQESVQILSLSRAEADLNFYCLARRSHPRLSSRLALMFTCIAMHVYCLCLGSSKVPHLQRQACSNTMQHHPVPDQFLQLHASATTAPWVNQDDRALAFRDVSPQVGERNCLGVENLMQ